MLRQEMMYDIDKGRYPKWFFFRSCRHTIRQINGWVYDGGTGKAVKDDDDFPENHYRIANIGPTYQSSAEKKSHTPKKKIVGIGNH